MSDQACRGSHAEAIKKKCLLRWVSEYTDKDVTDINSLCNGMVLRDVLSNLTDFIQWRDRQSKKVVNVLVKVVKEAKFNKKSDPCEKTVEEIMTYISKEIPCYQKEKVKKEAKWSILSGGEGIWTILVHLIDHCVIRKQLDQWKNGPKRHEPKLQNWLNYHLPAGWKMMNYTDDWRDGIRLNVLLHGISEEWCADWRELKPENALDNIRRALDIMTSKLQGVVQILDPKDIANQQTPDYCIVAFLSQLLGAKFSTGKRETLLNAKRRRAPTRPQTGEQLREHRPWLDPPEIYEGLPDTDMQAGSRETKIPEFLPPLPPRPVLDEEDIYNALKGGYFDEDDVYHDEDDVYPDEDDVYHEERAPEIFLPNTAMSGVRPRRAQSTGPQPRGPLGASNPSAPPPMPAAPATSPENDDYQVHDDQGQPDMDGEAVPKEGRVAFLRQRLEAKLPTGNLETLFNARRSGDSGTRELQPRTSPPVPPPSEPRTLPPVPPSGPRISPPIPPPPGPRNSPPVPPPEDDDQVQEDQAEIQPYSPYEYDEEVEHLEKARVLFSYEAQEDNELSLEEGKVINVISKVHAGWWFGESNGRTGLFPANYVSSLSSEEVPRKTPSPSLPPCSDNKHSRPTAQANSDQDDENDSSLDDETDPLYDATTIPGADEESEVQEDDHDPEKEKRKIDPAVWSGFRQEDVTKLKKCIKPACQYNLQIASVERYTYKGSRVLIDKVQYYEDEGGTEYFAMKSHYDSSKWRELLEEALIMIRFRRKTLMSLHGIVFMDKIPKLLVPWMRHGNLQEYLRKQKGKMQWRRILKFALDVTDGMLKLSEGSIIHRYLAAKHCLVDGEFQVKISDFSKCKDLFNIKSRVYQSDEKFDARSFAWMSLETLRKGIYSKETDLWSFGVVLWEIISQGGEPYENIANDSEMVETLFMHELLEMPKEIKEMLNTQDEEMLTGLMKKCWDPKPEKRPDWGEIKETLVDTDPYKYTHFYEKAYN